VVVIATMAVALAAVLPVTTLFHVSAGGLQPSLALVAVPGGDLGLPWSTPVRPPAATPLAWQSESSLLVAETAPLLWFGRAFAIQGWTMLAIAVVGAFALMSLWVQSLLGELGVRRAVGARRRDLFRFVLARAAVVSVAGLATGLWFGWPVWSELPRVIPGLGPWSTAIVSQAACVLVGAALAGALVPAWRVARMAPSVMIASRSA
jgi:hypothetical protein